MSEFALYQLDIEYINWNQFQNIANKDELAIKEWITPSMIESYDFSSHIITLNKSAAKVLRERTGGFFVAVAGGKRCYYGMKVGGIGDDSAPAFCQSFYPGTDLLWLSTLTHYIKKDLRNDETIKQTLKESGKYQGGIKITLDDLSVEERQDTTFFKYTFTITSIDSWNIYIVDPEDASINSWSGEGDNNLINIYKKDDNIYDAKTYQLIPAKNSGSSNRYITEEDLKPENLLYLKHGESVKRTYRSPLWPFYRKLPYGNYYAIYRHLNAYAASAEQRTLPGGRVLNGYVYSNIIDITYSKENGIVINNRNVILE
jgi:hypothetical protein